MTTTPRSVVIGVFRDRRLAEQALDVLRQTTWGIDNAQVLEKKTPSILGTFKKTSPSSNETADALPNELAQIDVPEEQRQLYQRELANGSAVVLLYSQSHLLEIRDVFNRYGAYHVFLPFQVGGEQIIPIRREVPQVQKHLVDVGEIRIHKRVITEERTFTVPVTREEVTIERLSLAPTAQPGQFAAQQAASMSLQNAAVDPAYAQYVPVDPAYVGGETLNSEGTIRILVREERVFIQKDVVVVEEIVVQKQVSQDIKHLVEPIKHEEVHIERVGNAIVHESSVEVGSTSVNENVPPLT